MFVTMDNKLMLSSTGPILGYPGSAIITHKGFVQIIDMLIGFSSEFAIYGKTSLGKLYYRWNWRIINYFTNLALREYDAAMAMSLSEVLDKLVPDVIEFAKKEGINLAPGGNIDSKTKVSRFMGPL